jgi:tetratricopeptide (TPR) repeat protein
VADALLRIDDLRRRVQRDSASLAFAQLGEELRRAGELDEAIRVCRAGLEYHPEYVSARVTLGRALLASNELDDAFVELSGVLQTAPENLAALRGLGETHQRRGDLEAALSVFRRALALAPQDAELAALVTAIQPSVPSTNGDGRKWPPPSGSHLIAKPSQTQKTGPHLVARGTPPTGRHPVATPGPIGLPVNEIDVRQTDNGDPRTAALDLLGAPPSDAEREHAALTNDPTHDSNDFNAAAPPSSALQQERDLHELLASLPMAEDQITPDAREMLASWSVAPVEPSPAPEQHVAPPTEPTAAAPPPLPMMLETEPAPPVLEVPSLEAVFTPPELTLTPPELVVAPEPANPVIETPEAAEPPASTEAVLPFPMRLATEPAEPAQPQPALNPIEAAQVALLERWLESIKAARAQDQNPAK